MSRRAKAWFGRALVASRLHRPAMRGRGVIVAFHRVNDAIPEDPLTKSSRDFERFCRLFKSSFDVVPLTEIVARLERGASINGALAITFDDGYLDNYEVAAPILTRLGLPATFFVTTEFLGSTVQPWWDAALPAAQPWMTWSQVRELRGAGFEIGAHTRTHADLGQIDGDAAEREIVGSQTDIQAQLDFVPQHFAYPYGQPANMMEENRERIRRAGFRSCVSCHGGLAVPGDDPLRLHRVAISPWFRTPEQFAFEVSVHVA